MHRLLALALLLPTTLFAQTPAFSEPSLSPDGAQIAFTSGGDIWTVAATGGDARLLVSDPALESRPLWSPDGTRIAFASLRTGNGDLYVLDLAKGDLRRLTWDDATDRLDAWSRDGKWIYFTSNSRDVAGMNDVFRVAADGGTPMQVAAERYINEAFAAPSPDGTRVALVGRGNAVGQWWRHGSSHIDESQIWTLDVASQKYDAITPDGARNVWPMWSPDGKRVWFVSDRGGNENIWSVTPGATPSQVTSFKSGRVLWPSIAYDGRTIVFERDFAIWKLDTANGSTAPIAITRRGVPSGPSIEHRRLTDRFSDLAVSPDGKKLAFAARGEVFAVGAKDGGDAVRVTNTPALESQLTWSPDSKTLVYISDRAGRTHLYQYDFATEKETQLTSGDANDDTPRFAPDGKSIAFQRDRRELVVYDLATKQPRSLTNALLDRPPLGSDRPFAWSPDSKWIAFLAFDKNLLRNAYVVPAAGGTAKPVSFLSNVFNDSIAWSRDGKFLLMATQQRTETGQLARIDLVPNVKKFREDQFRELFAAEKKDEKKDDKAKVTPAPSTVEIDFNGIRDRASFLSTGLDAGSVDISPDGKWVAFFATVGDNTNVYVYSIDELATDPAVPKQLSSTSTNKSDLQFSSDSKEVFYLDGGKIAAATIDPVKARTIAATAEMDVEFAREKGEAFSQAWRWLRDNFYDSAMHGVDWNATRDRFTPYVEAARTPDELRRLMQLMIGELNASHLGASAPADSVRNTTGRIGVRFDRDEYETSGKLKVSEVIPLSPAEVAKIKAGDVIVAVDGRAVDAHTNFDQLLEFKAGKRTVVTLDGTPRRDVIVQPIRRDDEKRLTYRAWVNANRDYVEKISNGRLGYVHMFDMGSDSLTQLHLDLDAQNRMRDGVVFDIRNNNGGFVNVYAIDVIARRPYLNMTFRDFPTAPARTILGQRSLEKPTVLLTNRNSLSDAEDFTEGYRTLKLGKVVGEPTAGWIIYTANVPLIDGTSFRLPFIKITDTKGENMERNPRPVDVPVAKPLGEKGDSQLDAAVKELLAGL